MKIYITKSFAMAKLEVEEWIRFFEDHGINLQVEKIQVLPVFCADDEIPTLEEVDFEPILIGEARNENFCGKLGFSYDEYFRIEEMFTTGKYRWKMSELSGVCEEKEIEKLSSAMVAVMLREWLLHMRYDHIEVTLAREGFV